MIVLTARIDALAEAAALASGAADYLHTHEISGVLLDSAIRFALRNANSLASIKSSRQFLQNTLDALACEIAILDQYGTIVMVNRAWLEFAEESSDGSKGIGVDYLAICRRALETGDALAGVVIQAITDIRDRKLTNCSLEYPCDSPERKLWFRLDIARFEFHGDARITLTHTDISNHR
jgi:PAS domain-containing protein